MDRPELRYRGTAPVQVVDHAVQHVRGSTTHRSMTVDPVAPFRTRAHNKARAIIMTPTAADVAARRAMMAALIAGQRDPTTLAQMVRTRMRAKIPQLEEALVGRFKDHHAFLLTQRSTSMCGRPCSHCGFPVAGFRRLERGALSDECAGSRRYDALVLLEGKQLAGVPLHS